MFVAAAGNNFSAGVVRVPDALHRLPRALPARHRRLRRDGRPPARTTACRSATMQGNWGPAEQDGDRAGGLHAQHAAGRSSAAPAIVDMTAPGTSSATPQVAAAAALYLQQHGAACSHEVPRALDAGRGGAAGAVHRAPTRTPTAAAARSSATASCGARRRWTSARRRRALHQTAARQRRRSPFLRVLTGLGVAGVAAQRRCSRSRRRSSRSDWHGNDRRTRWSEPLTDPDLPAERAGRAACGVSSRRVLEHPGASQALKARCGEARRSVFGGSDGPRRRRRTAARLPVAIAPLPRGADAAAAPPRRRPRPAVSRRCAATRIDPSLAQRARHRGDQRVTFQVPWENAATRARSANTSR